MPVTLSAPKINVQKSNAVMLSLQSSQWKRLETVAQNLTNASTPGYKSITTRREEAVYQTKDKKSISFVKTTGIIRNPSNGPIMMTGNPLHVGLITPGYFAVRIPSGQVFYTRDGRFLVDTQGQLVTPKGYLVLNSSQSAISVPGNEVSFTSNGTLLNKGMPLDRLGIFSFPDEQKIYAERDNLLSTDQEPTLFSEAKIVPGGLEEANVSTVEESIKMIEILRLFEQAQKIIEEYDQMKKKTINTSSKNL